MNVSARFALRLLVRAAVLALLITAASAQSDYTASLPSVEKVKAKIQGPDPTDTAARQVAVFEYLQVYIERIKSNRDYRGPYSPGEQRLRTDYAKAQYDLTQSFTKSHTPDELKKFNQLEGKYSINNALDWIKQLEGQQAADTYKGTEVGLAQSYKQHEDNLQKQMKQGQGGGSGSIAGDPVLDPMGIFARAEAGREKDPELTRCLELGESLDACQGEGALEGMASILMPFAPKEDPNAPPPVAGVVLIGNYHSRAELPSVGFGDGSATLQDCGTLVADSHNYSVRKSGATIQLILANEPEPIVMTMRPDGSLAGPGSVSVKGRIITGYTTTTSQVMVNGSSAASQGYYCNGPCSSSTSTPNYAPSIQRCTIGSMALVAPKPASEGPKTGIGFLDAISKTDPLVTGFRMTGQYIVASGMKLVFSNYSVVLDCGKAHTKAPYTVDNTPGGFVVHVQNSGGAFLLSIAPDNTLRGSGATTVSGKLVSSIKGDNVSFTPHSESCNVGTLSPRGKRNTMIASNGSAPSLPASYAAPAPTPVAAAEPATAVSVTPPAANLPAPAASLQASLAGAGISAAPAGARAQLRVILSSTFTGTNPLAGQAVFVARRPMDQILRELGVAVPGNATPAQAMKALQTQCHAPQGCTAVMQGLPKYYVTTTKLDSTGKATLSATTTTGSYYFFVIAPANGTTLMWDVPATLTAGDNTVSFTQANAAPVQ